MYKEEKENNRNSNINHESSVPDYSSCLNKADVYETPTDDYDEYAKELNPDDFE